MRDLAQFCKPASSAIANVATFEHYLPWLDKIAFDSNPQTGVPHWNNVWMPVLDAAAILSGGAEASAEVGSGNSTSSWHAPLPTITSNQDHFQSIPAALGRPLVQRDCPQTTGTMQS
jgi:hypothetical protein